MVQRTLKPREGLEALADYAGAMTSLFFYLPVILAWFGTVHAAAAFGWRILRWAGRRLFSLRAPVTVAAGS
jgi:hypothetical protein